MVKIARKDFEVLSKGEGQVKPIEVVKSTIEVVNGNDLVRLE